MAIDAAHPVPPLLPRNAGPDQIPPHVPKELIRSIGLTTGPEFLADAARLHGEDASELSADLLRRERIL